MSRALASIAVVLVVLASLMAGRSLTDSTSAQTGTLVSLRIQPGGTDNRLTCGWHTQCIMPFGDPQALDWGNHAAFDNVVYLRSYALRQDPFAGDVASGLVFENPTGCKRLQIIIRDPASNPLGSVFQTHTRQDSPENPVQIKSGSFTYGLTEAQTGKTLYEYGNAPGGNPFLAENPLGQCPYFGEHLHQYASTEFNRNIMAYPNAPSPSTPQAYNILDVMNWQNERIFELP